MCFYSMFICMKDSERVRARPWDTVQIVVKCVSSALMQAEGPASSIQGEELCKMFQMERMLLRSQFVLFNRINIKSILDYCSSKSTKKLLLLWFDWTQTKYRRTVATKFFTVFIFKQFIVRGRAAVQNQWMSELFTYGDNLMRQNLSFKWLAAKTSVFLGYLLFYMQRFLALRVHLMGK